MSTITKLCPACRKWITIEKQSGVIPCPKCNTTLQISVLNSSSTYHAGVGGVRIWVPKELRA